MSAGFSGAFGFDLTAAVDLEVAKPSGKTTGETGCNAVYEANHGLRPLGADLMELSPHELLDKHDLKAGRHSCVDIVRSLHRLLARQSAEPFG